MCAKICANLCRYEFWSQAITLFEEEITDSHAQIAAITLMVGSLETMTCFGEENYTALATQCAKVSSKLIKKPDQARGVLSCTHLFWSAKVTEKEGEEARDGKQVLKCLSKARKIANSCMEPLAKAAIFVEILNRAMLFYEWGAAEVSLELVQEFSGEVSVLICSLFVVFFDMLFLSASVGPTLEIALDTNG
jgi:vacuolar protein sorting-associated protein 35